MKIKILGILVIILTVVSVLPVASAIQILKENEIQDKMGTSGDYIQTMFLIGRIQDLQITDEDTSFIPFNVFLLMKQQSPDISVSYFGRVRATGQRMYFSDDNQFKGYLSTKFVFGIFRFEYHTPENPIILFRLDNEERTITVISIEQSDILWSDFQNVGDGSCNISTEGYVAAADQITDCYGTISLYYSPTQTIIATFEFQ